MGAVGCEWADWFVVASQMGIFCDVGPLSCFISTHVSHLLRIIVFNQGVLCRVHSTLPKLTFACCTPSQLIPPDFQFDPNANPPSFTSVDDSERIEKGTKIRLKIVGTRVDTTEIVGTAPLSSPRRSFCEGRSRESARADQCCLAVQFAIGTIREDYLGPLN